MQLRPFIFWPHLVAGVTAGAVILLMSVTGVLLTYERQMIAWSDSHLRSVPPSTAAERLPIETLLGNLRLSPPGIQPTAVTVGSEPDAPVVLSVPQRTIYVDAYSGAVLGEGTQAVRRVMSQLRAWHRWIAVEGEGRPLARAITGWSNVLFLFIVLSGIYLWLPRKWAWPNVRSVTFFRGGLRGKARDFNWHNVFGLWSAIPLFIVVISAVPISFPWGNAVVYRAVGEEVPRPAGREGGPAARRGRGPGSRAGGPGTAAAPAARGQTRGQTPGLTPDRDPAVSSTFRAQTARQAPARGGRGQTPGQTPNPTPGQTPGLTPLDGLNGLLARAGRQVDGWRTINMRMPSSPTAPVVFAIDKGDGGQPQHRSTLTLDRQTGGVVAYEAFSDLTLGRRIRSVMRFAHTGEVLGIPGQTIAGLVTFAGVMLVWTGIALALRRMRAWLRRRQDRPDDVAVRTSAA